MYVALILALLIFLTLWLSYNHLYVQQREDVLNTVGYFIDEADRSLSEVERGFGSEMEGVLKGFYENYETYHDDEYLAAHMNELAGRIEGKEINGASVKESSYYFISPEGEIFKTDYEPDLHLDLTQAEVWDRLQGLEAGEIMHDPITAEIVTGNFRLFSYIILPDNNIFELGLSFEEDFLESLQQDLNYLTGSQVEKVTFFDFDFDSFFAGDYEISDRERQLLLDSLEENGIVTDFNLPFSETFYYGWETNQFGSGAPRFVRVEVSYPFLLIVNILFVSIFAIFIILTLVARYRLSRLLNVEVVSPLGRISDKLSNFELESENNTLKIENNRVEEIDEIKNQYLKMAEEISATYQQLYAYSEEISQLNEVLEYQAGHDPLTDLPNRRSFMKVLKEDLKEGGRGAVVLLDLDNFKEINDTRGHVFGDKLLKAIAERLIAAEREDLFVARYGGDEFLILFRNIEDRGEVENRLFNIKETLDRPFTIEEESFSIEFSCGISIYPEDGCTTNRLITRADAAMYRAKAQLYESSLFFKDDMIHSIKEKRTIVDALQQAISGNGFELHFQPVVDLKNGKAASYESLLRLKNEDISPGAFIPVAEERKLIIEIGRWVTEAAIRQMSRWREQGLKLLPVSINFSASQLEDGDYVDFLKRMLKKYEIPADMLEIEITETIFLKETHESLRFLDELKKTGVKIVLDDFGTGYSSLNYLSFINLDKIKLDRSLCSRFLLEQDLPIMTNLIDLMHSLDLQVVAEGVEEKEDLEKLKKASCDLVQGYIFSRPRPADKVIEIYNRSFS